MLLCVFMESFTDLYMDVYGLFPLQLTMIWLCICKCTDLYELYHGIYGVQWNLCTQINSINGSYCELHV